MSRRKYVLQESSPFPCGILGFWVCRHFKNILFLGRVSPIYYIRMKKDKSQRGGNQSHSNYDVQKTRQNSKMKTHHVTLEERGGGMDKICLS
jgi:hypothetical protein